MAVGYRLYHRNESHRGEERQPAPRHLFFVEWSESSRHLPKI